MRIFVSAYITDILGGREEGEDENICERFTPTYWDNSQRERMRMRIFVSVLHTDKLGRRAEGEDENICERWQHSAQSHPIIGASNIPGIKSCKGCYHDFYLKFRIKLPKGFSL